jgi:hypothetical protein
MPHKLTKYVESVGMLQKQYHSSMSVNKWWRLNPLVMIRSHMEL